MSVREAAGELPASRAASGWQAPLAVRLAWRDLRGGLKGFRVFLACLALGVGAIAAVLSFSRALEEGAAVEGRTLLGGDLSFSVMQREASASEAQYLRGLGGVGASATLRSMARASDGTPGLVEVKAVDGAYPLYGSLTLAPSMSLDAALAERDGKPGLAVEDTLLARLGVEIGDIVTIGERDFELRAAILSEPDRLSDGFAFGPRALMSVEALAATGLVQPGSLVRWHYKVSVPDGQSDSAVRELGEGITTAFPDGGWRVRSRDRATPGVSRFTDRITLFLTLLGLTALLVGGVGVANATTAYLDQKAGIIATLKCVGATAGTIFAVYLIEILVLAVIGIAIGLVGGAALPVAVGALFGEAIPLPARFAVYPEPLVFAAMAGLLTAFAFSLWPLGRAREIPPAALFRDLVAPTGRWPRPGIMAMAGLAILALAVLVVAGADDTEIALGYVGGSFAAFVFLILIGHGIMALLARLPRLRRPELRLGLTNLHRPGAATPGIVLSLGLGLTMMVMVGQIDANLQRELADELPDRAPSFFFVDLRKDQVADFTGIVDETPTTANLKTVPMLRGRVSSVKGIPAAEFKPSGERWVLRGDRGITFATEIPDNSTVVMGDWWPADYSGPQLVSVTDEVAEAFDLTIGDTITFNVLGREIEARVANARTVDWRSLSINFVFIFSPGLIENAPHGYLATVEMQGEHEPGLLRDVVNRFPNVTAISVKDAIEAVGALVAKLMIAIRAGGGVAVLVGALVLGGAIAAGRRARIYDAVVLKTFGATRRKLLIAYLVEFGVLGIVAALFAALAGCIAAWLVLTEAMEADYTFIPSVVLQVLAIGLVATLVTGFLGTWRALGHKAATVLRSP